jgi:mono/diheme cytochrome c family protein
MATRIDGDHRRAVLAEWPLSEDAMTTQLRFTFGVAIGALLVAATLASGQSYQPFKTIWSGGYAKDEAARGKEQATQLCSRCHGADLKGGAAPALTGPAFFDRWNNLMLLDAVAYIQSAMPREHEFFVSADAAREILAFIFQESGVPAGSQPMPKDVKAQASILITRPPAK